MSFLSTLTDTFVKLYEMREKIKPIIKNKNLLQTIPVIFYIVSSVMLMFVLSQQYWNLLGYVDVKPLPLIDSNVGSFIATIISDWGFYWICYHFIARNIIRVFVGYIDITRKTRLSPYVQTFEDIIEILSSLVLFIYALNELLYFAHFGLVAFKNKGAYWFAFLYLISLLVLGVHRKNKDTSHITQTDYCDCNNKRIKVGDRVVYFNRLYTVKDGTKAILGYHQSSEKDPWILDSNSLYNPYIVSLEDAIKNREGRITIFED